MQNWLVILPPIILLLTAFISRNIILSVLLGIASAVLIGAQFSIPGTIELLYTYLKKQFLDPDFVNIYGFLFILGAIITLINFTGGSCAFGNLITKKLKNARKTESTSLFLSMLLCFDDYLNTLTMGCVMQPLTDKFKIPRVKLAYLIDVMASPVVVLLPVSSWIALIVKQLKLSGVTLGFSKFVQHKIQFPGGMFSIGHNVIVRADPFYTYIRSIPFIFYSFILVFSAWFIVRKKISYGPMARHEEIARKTGNLYGGKEPRFKMMHHHKSSIKIYLSDFLAPIVSLVVGALLAIPYTGGYYLFGGSRTLLESFRFANIFQSLFFASVISLLIGISLGFIHKKIKMLHLPLCIARGVHLMYPSAIIIFCALLFSNILDHELHAGQYVAQLILPYINIHWLPVIVFLMTTLVALGTGSSWAAFSIMFPIAIPMISSLSGLDHPVMLAEVYILLPTIGAVISGSLAGAQLSPISDPITMSSTSAGCYQMDHIKTQIWYILPATIGSAVSFIAAGYLTVNGSTLNGIACMAIGLALTIALIYAAHKIYPFFKKRSLK